MSKRTVEKLLQELHLMTFKQTILKDFTECCDDIQSFLRKKIAPEADKECYAFIVCVIRRIVLYDESKHTWTDYLDDILNNKCLKEEIDCTEATTGAKKQLTAIKEFKYILVRLQSLARKFEKVQALDVHVDPDQPKLVALLATRTIKSIVYLLLLTFAYHASMQAFRILVPQSHVMLEEANQYKAQVEAAYEFKTNALTKVVLPHEQGGALVVDDSSILEKQREFAFEAGIHFLVDTGAVGAMSKYLFKPDIGCFEVHSGTSQSIMNDVFASLTNVASATLRQYNVKSLPDDLSNDAKIRMLEAQAEFLSDDASTADVLMPALDNSMYFKLPQSYMMFSYEIVQKFNGEFEQAWKNGNIEAIAELKKRWRSFMHVFDSKRRTTYFTMVKTPRDNEIKHVCEFIEKINAGKDELIQYLRSEREQGRLNPDTFPNAHAYFDNLYWKERLEEFLIMNAYFHRGTEALSFVASKFAQIFSES